MGYIKDNGDKCTYLTKGLKYKTSANSMLYTLERVGWDALEHYMLC